MRNGLAVLAPLREPSGTRFAWRMAKDKFVTDRPALDLRFGSASERPAHTGAGPEENAFLEARRGVLLYSGFT